MKIEPITLEGKYVRLEPVSVSHKNGLAKAIEDGSLYNLHVTGVPHPEDLSLYIEAAVECGLSGDGLAFVTINKMTEEIVGSTRFFNFMEHHKRAEIGHTFISQSFQRSGINTEAKYLMLSHGFEVLDLNRIEFLTDYLNVKSRAAISRLGAKEEGLLRSHMVMRDGRVRDSVIYSITRSEWPGVKIHLEHKML